MKNSIFSSLCDAAGKSVMKHLPEVLAGAGIAGFFTAGVWAVASTPKALNEIEKKKEELHTDKLTVAETVQCTWKYYISPIGLSFAAAGCVIGGTKESLRRNAALMTMYAGVEQTLRDYREKVLEEVGPTKAKRIDGAVAEKQIQDHPASQQQVFITSGGNVKCYDAKSGRYFMSDPETIQRKITKLNNNLLTSYQSLNEYYYLVGLAPLKDGDLQGWPMGTYVEPKFDHCLDENNVPCLVVDFYTQPKYKYDDLH